jgi:ATP-dependent Clp protease ATP-binding subunit ClpA
MKRAITSVILNPLSQKLLSSEIQSGDTVQIWVNSEWELTVVKK